jgi:PAS domain S-box-containing protein
MIALRTGEEVRNVTLAVWRPEQEEYRWLQVSAVPCFREGEDQPYQVYSTFSDITDERHTKEALAKEHRLMRTIIDQLPSFVYLKDREGRFLMHNSSLPAGVSAETNLMGKTSLEVFPEPFASMCHQFGQEVLRTGQGIVNREALIHAPDGTERHYLCTKVPLTDSDGDIVGIVGISHDVTDFQALARAMEESEARYRALVQELPIGVFVHRAGRLLYANPAALELFRSRSIEDFVSRPIAAYVDPDDREAIVERSHSIVRSDAPVGEMIARYVRLDGSSFPMATMGIPHSWGGEPAALSIGIDVTERVRAEEGLLASEREKAAILDTISDQVVYKGPDGRIIWANRAFADGAQRDPDELVGQTCPHQGDHRCAACPVEVAIATGRLHSAEVEAGNGSTWAVRAYPVHADDGELAGIVEVARDVTEQQRAAQSLRLSAQRQRLHFDRSPVAVVEWGLDHRVVEWNPAAEALFGYTKQEAVGRHAYFIVPDEIRGHVDANLEALRLGCGGERSTNPNRRKDGSPLMCEWYNTALVDESGQVIGFASQVLDVTQNAHFDEERRKLEESSQRTQRLESIGVLAGGIAHDFNNILSAIIGYGELAVLDTAEGSSERRRIEQIVQAGGRARDLVKQILTFSRQHDAEMSSVSLQPIVKESMKFLRASLPATIDFDEDIDRRCGRVTVDPTQFHQIVMNLCTNAGYAMREGGGVLEVRLSEVEVDASLAARLDVDGAGTYARLTVSDTGLGMDKETVDRIFEPFFSTKPEGEGTGLGLSTVHGIVRASGGGISVYSEPGVGTTFHVYLPLVSAGEDAQADAPAALPTGAERVMVVDDEPSVVAMAAEALRVLGYEVDEFVDSREALRTFREDPDRYQLVLTDQTMPHFTGTQLLASVKFLRPEIPVVIATGYQPRVESDLAGYSVTPMVLAKPYTIMELAQAVRDSIEAKTTMADDASTKEASTP